LSSARAFTQREIVVDPATMSGGGPVSKEFPLDGFALEIKAHWERYRPEMYRQLEQAGNLDQALHEASERTEEAFAHLVEKTASSPRRRGKRCGRSGPSCQRRATSRPGRARPG
jgi:hypothetical protein